MWARGRSENKLIAIVKDDKCIGRVSCGNKYDTHLGVELLCGMHGRAFYWD
jgi:hypothetical protein